jgi:3-methyl-2-oxobutanoate hydroxymethyltransferase
MGLYYKRPTVADIRALKGKRQLTMLYVDTPDEAASAAGIDMLSITEPIWTPKCAMPPRTALFKLACCMES